MNATMTRVRAMARNLRHALHAGDRPFPDLTREADEAVTLAGCLTAGLAGALLAWMMGAPLISAVTVEGFAVAADNRKAVQHPSGGIVAEVLVSEGDLVREHQPLIRLDATAATARREDVRANWITNELKHARLLAEQHDRPDLAIPEYLRRAVPLDELRPVVERERVLMASRRAQTQLRRSTLAAEIAERRARITGLAAERDSKDAQAALVARELEGKTHLYAQGYAALTSVLSLQRSQAALTGDRDKAAAQLRETEEAILGKELELRRLDADDKAAIAEEMTRVAASLESLNAAMKDADLGHRWTTITAPGRGRVIGLTVRNAGAVVNPGDILMEIVPEGSRLQLEGSVGPADGPLVTRGAPVRVRFLSDPAWEAPLLPGQVTYISDDVMPNGLFEGLFKVRVELDAPDRHPRPGAPVVMFVENSAHTPLSYLASPLIEIVQRSLRER